MNMNPIRFSGVYRALVQQAKGSERVNVHDFFDARSHLINHLPAQEQRIPAAQRRSSVMMSPLSNEIMLFTGPDLERLNAIEAEPPSSDNVDRRAMHIENARLTARPVIIQISKKNGTRTIQLVENSLTARALALLHRLSPQLSMALAISLPKLSYEKLRQQSLREAGWLLA
ncbi:MAG: hypothetical protein K2X01_00245 [Cyanobacteria bacterium]|nr:hypothetical protein [Cyanobacteriota bacterium]